MYPPKDTIFHCNCLNSDEVFYTSFQFLLVTFEFPLILVDVCQTSFLVIYRNNKSYCVDTFSSLSTSFAAAAAVVISENACKCSNVVGVLKCNCHTTEMFLRCIHDTIKYMEICR